jgi:dienelactone hydrolase
MISTPDSKQVSANYFYSEGKKETPEPLVILIHQFMQTKEQWQQSFVDSLLVQGYKVLAYDIRGHGKSSKVAYELSKLLEDPDEAPNDIRGVFGWAKNQKGIDTLRIAAIGTSIGGNVACYASFKLGAKTSVAISNGKETFEKFLNYDERAMSRPNIPRATSIFFICGSKDDDHEKGQRFMMDDFVNDPKDIKVFDSDKHGKDLIDEHPEIYTLILNWLKKNL